jgi:serine/threonine protein kinase
VLHRDIKPSNLLLDAQGCVWVTDFGLAKQAGCDVTGSGDVVGTLRYMAPERFRGSSDAASDIYGLGVTLYELLTTQPAFVPGSDRSLIHLRRQVLHSDTGARKGRSRVGSFACSIPMATTSSFTTTPRADSPASPIRQIG